MTPALILLLTGCDAAIDRAALERLVQLEWADPPAGTRAQIACDGESWTLALEAPGLLPVTEQHELPKVSGNARTRVLALIISERGRALTNAPPASPPVPEVPPPLVESVRAPVVPPDATAQPPPPPETPSSPLRDALFTNVSTRSNTWHLGVAAVALTPFSIGPWRFGPEIRVQASAFALAISATVGTRRVDLGDLSVYAITAEPELTVACLGGSAWRICAAARGIAGYGAVTAKATQPGIEGKRFDGVLLGGAAILSASLALASWLALEADGRLGATWGVVGAQAGDPVASLGGGLAGAGLSLTASCGRP